MQRLLHLSLQAEYSFPEDLHDFYYEPCTARKAYGFPGCGHSPYKSSEKNISRKRNIHFPRICMAHINKL